jgi:hypothetical protein
MQCIMFDRSDAFCDVCNEAINVIIDLYSQSKTKNKSLSCQKVKHVLNKYNYSDVPNATFEQ